MDSYGGMNLEHEITFHGIPHDNGVETLVRERVQRLPHFYDRVQRCRVVLESGPAVKVVVGVPHRDPIVVSHASSPSPNATMEASVRDTFELVERQLRHVHDQRTRHQ